MRIEKAQNEIAIQWEERLLEEMYRLKNELEQIHVDDRIKALDELKKEFAEETEMLKENFQLKELELRNEVGVFFLLKDD